MSHLSDGEAARLLRCWVGSAAPKLLGAGMEGSVYDPTGKDGHFAWCAAALNRHDVTHALLGG